MIATTVKFFGQYLLEKGRISSQQLLDVVDFQSTTNARLGTLASERGFLSEDQVKQVNSAQKTTDRLFGDLAVDLGYLTSEQLAELVEIQKTARLFLGEALVEKGILSADDLERELALFKAEQQSSQMMIRGALVQLKSAELIVDVLDMVLKLFKRIIHENVLIEDCHQDRSQWLPFDWVVSQEFTGDVRARFYIGIPNKLLLKIASKMLEEPFTEAGELAQDAAKEFVNVMCGNICAKLSQRDLNVSLKPPKIVLSRDAVALPDGYSVITSLIAVDFKFDMALVQQD